MLSQLKLFGGLMLLLAILVVVYLLMTGFLKFGIREESVLRINGKEIEVEIVNTPLAQARGLSGRDAIGENKGMLFVFNEPAVQKFWMKGMKFPIDIIWIKDNMIVGFEENVQPEPGISDGDLKIYSSAEPVEKVLELQAGGVRRLGIEVGTLVE